METAHQKTNHSTANETQSTRPPAAALATPTTPRRAQDCRTGLGGKCPCSGLDRLEIDLGIQESGPNQMLDAQVAKDITPAEAVAMIEAKKGSGSLVVLDVSTGREFRKWHVEKAININIFSLKFPEKLNELDRERTYLVYCKMGGRSAAAQKVMIKQGFRKVLNIAGGRDRWRSENLPYGSGPARFGRVRACPVSMTINAVARLRANLKGRLGALRATAEAGNHPEKP